MTRARIDKIRIRVRGPLDARTARAIGARIAQVLPGRLGELGASADRVAGAVGEAVENAAKEPR